MVGKRTRQARRRARTRVKPRRWPASTRSISAAPDVCRTDGVQQPAAGRDRSRFPGCCDRRRRCRRARRSLCRRDGARVAVVGRSRRGEATARESGAELFIATEEADPAVAPKAWDGGVNLILNSAPSTAAGAAAFTGLAPDGTLAPCGDDDQPLTLPMGPAVTNRPHTGDEPRPARRTTSATRRPSPRRTTSCRVHADRSAGRELRAGCDGGRPLR